MKKGERTKQQIIASVAPLFNERGYFATSMADVMRVSKQQKGTIYRYFESKDDLALAAFDYAYAKIKKRFAKAITDKTNTVERLIAIVEMHAELLEDPFFEGGCPIFNTAVEGDDTHPELFARALRAMQEWQEMIKITLIKGMERAEMKDINPNELSSIIISSLEGSIVMAKLYADKSHIKQMANYLRNYILTNVAR